jgi:hypothetical protein
VVKPFYNVSAFMPLIMQGIFMGLDYESTIGSLIGVMVQRVLLPSSRQSDEATTVRELLFIVKCIQATFGPQVIDNHELAGTSMPMDQRSTL